MAKSKIEWCDRVWNPVTGCTKVSPGCLNCYAERMSKRFAELWGLPKDDPFKVTMHHDRLKQPLHWKKDSKVFVCSMADIFHDDVTDAVLDQIFGVMLATKVLNNRPDHTFMVLTKRAERMHRYFTSRTAAELLEAWAFSTDWVNMEDGDVLFHEYIEGLVCHDWDEKGTNSSGSEYKEWGYLKQLFPLPNVWLGVTAENQEQADKRIPLLLATPTVKRFVSVEPMLGPVDLTDVPVPQVVDNRGFSINALTDNDDEHFFNKHQKLDWVICGGESGPGARPVHPAWVRSLRDQCISAEVPFLFKQWGEFYHSIPQNGTEPTETGINCIGVNGHNAVTMEDGLVMERVGKTTAGRLLDGQLWDQYPVK